MGQVLRKTKTGWEGWEGLPSTLVAFLLAECVWTTV